MMFLGLQDAQIEQLLKPINGQRVGRDGKGFSHLEAFDVRAHLIRIFGFATWSADTDEMELIFEQESAKDGKARWTVAYRAKVTLTMPGGVTYTEWAVGDSQNNPSRADAHDMAIKTAESQAFKRCAVNLGDQFGLSLYAAGSLDPVVRRTLTYTPEPTEVTPAKEKALKNLGVPHDGS